MSSRAPRARPAISRLLTSEPLGGVSLVRVAIDTGRTHQIRVHLSETGHPVVGDDVYGGTRASVPPRLAALAKLKRPFLHAARLAFRHPGDGRPLSFEAPLPGDLAGVLAALRRAAGRAPDAGSRHLPGQRQRARSPAAPPFADASFTSNRIACGCPMGERRRSTSFGIADRSC